MHERMSLIKWWILVPVVGITAVVAGSSILALTTNAPPLGNCFEGILSQDPLHCYGLEQSQNRGLIDVETVYAADGVLYFSLRQDTDVADSVYDFIKAKSYEFYDRWPSHVPVNPGYDLCVGVRELTYRQCYLEETAWVADFMLPQSMVYDEIRFHTGGETARVLLPGWASWRQVWPATAAGASGSSETPTTFDVSDVDMTNLPVDACPEVIYASVAEVCSRDRDVALSIVGRHKGYFQIKDPPTDEAGLAALKEILVPCYSKAGPCTYMATTTVTSIVDGVETHTATRTEVHFDSAGGGKIAIIPVKYSWEELVGWAEILDRFATSRGNVIGIKAAKLGDNRPLGYAAVEEVIWPLDDLGPAGYSSPGFIDSSDIRDTIVVLAGDAQRVADALPTLLPLLGIPVDAVGLVVAERQGHFTVWWDE